MRTSGRIEGLDESSTSSPVGYPVSKAVPIILDDVESRSRQLLVEAGEMDTVRIRGLKLAQRREQAQIAEAVASAEWPGPGEEKDRTSAG